MDHVLPQDVREVLEAQPAELFTGAVVPLKELPEGCRIPLAPPLVGGWTRGVRFAAAFARPGMDRLVIEICGRQFFIDMGEIIGAANAVVAKGRRP